MIGSRLGVYEVVALLGAGGMGEVYRARDTRLGRDVAIKVLPAEFTGDGERLARFEAEARVLASLNHPNIATIYGVEETTGIKALVMEVVEGETLGERMVHGHRLPAGTLGLPITEALTIARQIAEALEAAHDKGIVHRDLKPANIKVTPGGAVKVLDFGLAKAGGTAAGEGAASQATTVNGTQEGRILGTAAYMSPEQARGLTVDTRTDVWAFGCVLFEMLTGRQVFAGATFSDTLAAVIEREPDWTLLPPATPPMVRRLLRRCLAKDSKDRPRHMGDIGIELKDALQELATGAAEGPQAASAVVRAPRRWGWAVATLAAVMVVSAYAGWQAWRSPGVSPPLRAVPLTSLPGITRSPSFSPDGNQVAFSWTGPDGSNSDIYVQQVGAGAPLRLTTDPGNDHNPMWSPDGRWIAFLRGEGDGRPQELRLVPPLTGSQRRLTEVRPHGFLRPLSLAWCPDSSCVVVTDSLGEGKPDALFAISLDSGEKRQLTHPPVFADSDPAISPDGKWLVFRREVAPFAGGLELVPLRPDLTEAGEPRRLTPTTLYAYTPRWTPDSAEIVFSAKEALWRLRITGEGTPERLPFVGEDGVTPIVSNPGRGGAARLAYVRSYTDANIWRIDTAVAGRPASSPPVVAVSSTRRDAIPHISPDGRQVAFTSTRSGEMEIWRADVSGGGAVQLTSMRTVPGWPRWAPDGQQIAFHTNGVDGNGDIFVVSAEGGQPRNVTAHTATDAFPAYSRDGRWIYFSSTRTGRPTIWKVQVSGGPAVQVSDGLGLMAIESPDGAYLYYTGSSNPNTPAPLWRLPVAGGNAVKIAEGVNSTGFDVQENGIYYLDRVSGQSRLQFFDLVSRRVVTVAGNLGGVDSGVSASTDGRTILFTRTDSSVNDLMLVEGFR